MKMIIRKKNKLHLSKLLKYFLIRPKRNLFQMIFLPAFKKGPFSPLVRMLSKLWPMSAGSKPASIDRRDCEIFLSFPCTRMIVQVRFFKDLLEGTPPTAILLKLAEAEA